MMNLGLLTTTGLLPDAGTRLTVLALELPKSITPMIAGLTVGVVVGLVGIIAVLLLVGRSNRRPVRRPQMAAAERVVHIPPYGTMQRDTPLPPQAFATPRPAYGQPPQARAAYGAPLPFTPSSSLSARAFAKMGYEVDEQEEVREAERDAPHVDPHLSVSIQVDLDEDDLFPSDTPVPPTPAVLISPVVVLSAPRPAAGVPPAPQTEPLLGGATRSSRPSHVALREAESGTVRAAEAAPTSAPHPNSVIKSSSSAMMRAASIADLEMDDNPTEIGETYFDEPPQPRRRTDPPKIRAIAPAAPRFPAPRPEPTPLLPNVTAPSKIARRS